MAVAVCSDMGDKSRGPGPPGGAPLWVVLLCACATLPHLAVSEKNKLCKYLSSLCILVDAVFGYSSGPHL